MDNRVVQKSLRPADNNPSLLTLGDFSVEGNGGPIM